MVAGLGLTVVGDDDGWWMTFPGFPDVGARLHPCGERWIIDGGPLDGAEVDFETGTIGGTPVLTRLADPPPALAGGGIAAPPLRPDPERDRRFERVWRSASGPIQWSLDDPKHEFVQWLEHRRLVVFHGSNRSGIEEFSTQRESIEIDDAGGRGNLQAVYATARGLWAIYFAVVDRTRLRGSLRNGVADYLDEAGRRVTRYNLSLSSHDLANRPFTTGTLYLLERGDFSPIPLYPGGPPSQEWACPHPVRPVASITFEPHEYPLLESIGAHDESDRIEYADAAEAILGLVVDVEATDPDLVLRLSTPPDSDLVDRYVRLGAIAYPGTERTVEGSLVTISGPEHYRNAVGRSVRNRLATQG